MPEPIEEATLAALDYLVSASPWPRSPEEWVAFCASLGMDEVTAREVVARLGSLRVLYERNGVLSCDAAQARAVHRSVERLVRVKRHARPRDARVTGVAVSGSDPRRNRGPPAPCPPTRWQRLILRRIAQGESVRGIAERLGRHATVVSEACIRGLAPRGLIEKDPATRRWRVTPDGARLAEASASEGCPSHPDAPDGSACSRSCPRGGVRFHRGHLYAPWVVPPEPARAAAAFGRLRLAAVPLRGWTKRVGTLVSEERPVTVEVTPRGVLVRVGAVWAASPVAAAHEALRWGSAAARRVECECGGTLGPLRLEGAEFAYVGHPAANEMMAAGIPKMERVFGMWWDTSENVPELETDALRVAEAIEAVAFEGGDVRAWLAAVAAKAGVA